MDTFLVLKTVHCKSFYETEKNQPLKSTICSWQEIICLKVIFSIFDES